MAINGTYVNAYTVASNPLFQQAVAIAICVEAQAVQLEVPANVPNHANRKALMVASMANLGLYANIFSYAIAATNPGGVSLNVTDAQIQAAVVAVWDSVGGVL